MMKFMKVLFIEWEYYLEFGFSFVGNQFQCDLIYLLPDKVVTRSNFESTHRFWNTPRGN